MDGIREGAPMDGADIFSSVFPGIFGRQPGASRSGPRRGQNAVKPFPVSLEDLYTGKERRLKIRRNVLCKDCKGSGGENVVTCSVCNGQGQVSEIRPIGPGFLSQVTRPCDKCNGRGKTFDPATMCKTCSGKGIYSAAEQITVHIDPGMKDGQKIVFSGKADEAPDIIPGDLIFVLRQKPHPTFERKGNHLFVTKEITLLEALTGVKYMMTHLDGRNILIQSAPGKTIQPDSLMVVKNEGMPSVNNRFLKGMLIIRFKVKFPEKVTPDMAKSLEKILPPRPPLPSYDRSETDEYTLSDFDPNDPAFSQSHDHHSQAYDSDEEEVGGERVCVSH